MVDVGVHAGERELDRRDARVAARREQRRPTARYRHAGAGSVHGGEVKAGKDDIQGTDELGMLESRGTSSGIDRHRLLEVQVVEARLTVASRKLIRDSVHASENSRYRIGGAGHPDPDSKGREVQRARRPGGGPYRQSACTGHGQGALAPRLRNRRRLRVGPVSARSGPLFAMCSRVAGCSDACAARRLREPCTCPPGRVSEPARVLGSDTSRET